jgi:catechol-2,3-dioxygenase
MKITGIGHVVLPTRDVEAGLDFYQRVLGLEKVAYLPFAKMGFLSLGKTHHDIALCQVADDEPVGSPGNSHTGIHVDGGPEALEELRDRLVAADVEVEEVHDYGFMNGFYFKDLDQNRIELFCDVMSEDDALKLLRSKQPTAAPAQAATAGEG